MTAEIASADTAEADGDAHARNFASVANAGGNEYAGSFASDANASNVSCLRLRGLMSWKEGDFCDVRRGCCRGGR